MARDLPRGINIPDPTPQLRTNLSYPPKALMILLTMSLAELHPAPYNPRLTLKKSDKRYRKLKRSLQRFGLLEPLIWNRRTGYLVGGHQRRQILMDLGVQDVPVSVVDLPPAQEKALNLVLNNREAQADWQLPQLTILLQDLASSSKADFPSSGFDPSHLATLQNQLAPQRPWQLEPLGDPYVEIMIKIPCPALAAVQPKLDTLFQITSLELQARLRFPAAEPC
jgi:hypothetical protein